MDQLIKTQDANVVMLYSRRSLEVIITDLCECELKRPRKTEPLKGIIDKLNSEEKVPSHIITSMHGLNSLATYGAHPKEYDQEQVKPVLSNLSIIIKWYLKYKDPQVTSKAKAKEKKIEGKYAEVPAAEKSIAVLPFKNDSPDEGNTYFINGIMEEILTNLQAIKVLRVISRTSAEQYRNQNKSIPEIAGELGVNYIVEGSAQKYGNTFRLRVQLIMAAKESHLWAKSYQQEIQEATDIFNIQSQIAEAIATELGAAITPNEKLLIEKEPTKILAAYDAYLKGQFYWRKLTKNDLETAMQYFELAKEKDPGYALAYAGICDVWVGLQQMGFVPPSEAGPKAMGAAMKALELDNTRAEVHYTLALMKTWGMWDWKGGESAFKNAIALNPNYAEAHAYYSHFLNIVGRPEEAMEQIDLALKMDPHNPLLKTLHIIDLLFVRRYDEAIAAAQEVLKIDPTSKLAMLGLIQGQHFAGKFDEALETLKGWSSFFDFKENLLSAIDKGYGQNGYIGALHFLADTLAVQSKSSYITPTDITLYYALAGDKELAIKFMEQSFNSHDPNFPYLRMPTCDIINNDPRTLELLKKAGLTNN